MYRIAVCARKGGSGKTTIAAHLAVAAAAGGARRVALVDLDTQASLTDWSAARAEHGRAAIEVAQATPATLDRVLNELERDGVDVVVVDTPPSLDAPVIAAARSADVVLVPARPSALDLRAVAGTIALVRGTAQARCFVVLNAARANDADVAGARTVLRRNAVETSPRAVCDRVAFRRSMVSGGTAIETEARGAAAEEVMQLWLWLARTAGLNDRRRAATAPRRGGDRRSVTP